MLFAGFLFSVFMEYVRPGTYLPIIDMLRLNSLVPLAVLIATVFHKSEVSDGELFRNRNTKWLLFFMGLLAVSVLIADVTEYSFKIFKLVLGFVFWYYMIVKLVTTKQRLVAVFATLAVSHVVLLILNPQVVLNPATRSYIHGNAFLGDGNDYSLSVVIVVPLCIYLLLEAKTFWLRAFWLVALLGLILGVVGTQSRGASIALACVFLFLWWKGKQKAFGLVLIAAIVAIVVSFAPPVYFERLGTVVNYQEEGSAMGRIIAWRTAVRMAQKYPLLGVGTGHFPVKLGTEFRPPEYGSQNLPWLTAHSMYFLILGELGVPGITFLLAMLIGNYLINNRLMRESRRSSDGMDRMFLMLNASLIAFAVGGAFLSVAYYPHLYILTGIWTAAYFTQRRMRNSPDDAGQEIPDKPLADRVVWNDGGREPDVVR